MVVSKLAPPPPPPPRSAELVVVVIYFCSLAVVIPLCWIPSYSLWYLLPPSV